jgi:abnormal spindle-like microcephaly-associated protein
LNHLDCQVKYKQHPLQEYDYQIKNLAVDLRDGILLTRLVELLLYPSTSFLPTQQHKPDSTDTVATPTGEDLALPPGERDWPLSQHLKFPCVGRVTKVFNVQIALGALAGVRGVGFIAQDIRAEDIVDGYREKTVALLWGLVGKWGLTGLVDWDDVRKEIVRLKRKTAYRMGERQKDRRSHSEEVEEDFDEGYERYSFLLKQWASCLAGLKGLQLDNLTTSFADGRIFESIVAEYERYICVSKCVEPISAKASDEGTPSGRPETVNLATRLRALGCSAQFCESPLVVIWKNRIEIALTSTPLLNSFPCRPTTLLLLLIPHLRPRLRSCRACIPLLSSLICFETRPSRHCPAIRVASCTRPTSPQTPCSGKADCGRMHGCSQHSREAVMG